MTKITATPEEAKAIVKEAYLYGWPMSENYNTMNAYAINVGGSNYKAPFNVIKNEAKVFGPADNAVVSPNSDTPYSFLWADVRTEPIVITVPPMDGDRYYSFQLIDLYTFNFDYIGTRTQFEEGGTFLVAGPGWDGPEPPGITDVFHCETEYFLSVTRTQLFNPQDLDNVQAIQSQYIVQTLSEYLDSEQTPLEQPDWPAPCEKDKTPAIFTVINFMLQFCPTVPSEQALMQEFAKIGVGPGLPFDAESLSPEMKAAFEEGIAEAWAEFEVVNGKVADGTLSTADFFGSRAEMDNNYLYRFAGAKLGLYGNTKEEAMYPSYLVDADGNPLDASGNNYTLTITEALPAKAFASVTMYDAHSQLLVENSINRYLINTPMIGQLKKNEDGSVTIYIQYESPGSELESNWLPAPNAPFYMAMRLYIPEQEALDGTWVQPPVVRVG